MDRKVFLSNLPENLDEWMIKKLLPCANLFVSMEFNPGDNTKMIAETQSRQHALQVAEELDGCEFLDYVAQAKCVGIASRDSGVATRMSSASVSSGLSDRNSTVDTDGTVSIENAERGSKSSGERSFPADASDSGMSSTAERAVLRTASQDMEDATIPVGLHRETLVVDVVPPRPLRCRNCLRLGHHDTYHCKEYAEYYSVSFSEKARNDANAIGCCWPDIAVHKIIGVNAGPVIKYFENMFFHDTLSRDEIFVMFAFIANAEVCNRNGDRPTGPTFADMASRESMCGLMEGLRRTLSLARLQEIAEAVSFKGTRDNPDSSAGSVKRDADAENFEESSRAAKFNGIVMTAMGNKPEITRPVTEEFHAQNAVNISASCVKANETDREGGSFIEGDVHPDVFKQLWSFINTYECSRDPWVSDEMKEVADG